LTNHSKEERERDAAKARAQYEAEGQAIRERTARLRSLRLAKEAAESATGGKKNAVARKGKKSLPRAKQSRCPCRSG
jgi:hypothetical protein